MGRPHGRLRAGNPRGLPRQLRLPRPQDRLQQRKGLLEAPALPVSSTRSWRKHERLIALDPWQQEIVDAHPWEFIRGLIHSDGCRITNWTTRLVGGERKRYEYPRYFFTNVSDDIRRLCTDTLDKLGIEWTRCTRNGNPYNISVAKKTSVALMDTHVGPKH